MSGSYRYSAALDKTYMEQRWVPPSAPATQPVRTVPIIRTVPVPSASDPLRFIKVKQPPLGKQAREQLQAYESSVRNHVRAKLDEQEEQWQTNLDEWKSRRRKASERAFQRVQDAKELFPDEGQKQPEPEPEPTLTTSTELLSEYSTREEFIPTNTAVHSVTTARPASKGPKPPVPPKPMAELRRKEFPPNGDEANEQEDSSRRSAPAEATLSVSGRKLCSHCNQPLGHGAAMVIESLQLLYHLACFRCCVCQAPLGNGLCGTDVRVRNTKLHCTDCYSNDEAGVKLSRV
ncbi:smallish [Dermacentor variabilis]|uniref:smallish n=1 Tax=Dermacentor variabilis TaxID=34621 RepID=UPI003F5BC950